MAKLTVKWKTHKNRRFFEYLGNGVRLEMVLVPGGTLDFEGDGN